MIVILIYIAEIVGSYDFGAFDLQQFIKDPERYDHKKYSDLKIPLRKY